MKIAIKDLRPGMLVYDEDLNDSYRVYSNPYYNGNTLEVEVTTGGDYVWYLKEGMDVWTTPDRKD